MPNPPKVHEKLQDLQDVLDLKAEREKEIKELTGGTAEELEARKKEMNIELARDIAHELKDAMSEFKENLKSYMEVLGNTPDKEKLMEKDVEEILAKLEKEFGLTASEIMEMLGLKESTDDNEHLSEEDVITEEINPDVMSVETDIADATGVKSVDLDKHVMSVYKEYSKEDMAKISTPEEFAKFLQGKWQEVRPTLIKEYAIQPEQQTESAFTGKQKGLLEKFMPMNSEVKNPELQKFFHAIQEVGGEVDPDTWVENGELNQAVMDQQIEMQIQTLGKKAGKQDLELYKKASSNENLSADGELTKLGYETAAEYIEEIPDKMQKTKFAKEYQAYVENKLKEKEIPKPFDEWLEERPKAGGIEGIMDTVKLLLAKSGLTDILKNFFDFSADSWVGRLLGAEKTDEEKEDNQEFEKQEKYKNKNAWEYAQKAKTFENAEKIQKLDWTGIKIDGIDMGADGKPDLKDITPDDLVILEAIVNKEKPSALVQARTAGLSLEDLIWMHDNDSDITPTNEKSFVITGSDKIFKYTEAGLEQAQEILSGDGKIIKQVGKHAKKFEEKLPSKAFVSADENFENLQPAMQSLLGLPERYWGDYVFTPEKLDIFLAAMGESGGLFYTKYFRNIDDAFEDVGSSFKVREGMFSWTNSEFKTVKDFIESL